MASEVSPADGHLAVAVAVDLVASADEHFLLYAEVKCGRPPSREPVLKGNHLVPATHAVPPITAKCSSAKTGPNVLKRSARGHLKLC